MWNKFWYQQKGHVDQAVNGRHQRGGEHLRDRVRHLTNQLEKERSRANHNHSNQRHGQVYLD